MTQGNEIIDYFAKKASQYDRVDEQVYWRLSDTLLWELLESKVLKNLPTNFRMLDAGGGTGRWSDRVLTNYPAATGMIVDLSPDMLGEAEKKSARLGGERLSTQQGNIEDMNDLPSNAFDLVINFHNVIGFLKDPERGISEMTRVLCPGGYLVTVAPSLYHMAFFNIYLRELSRAEETIKERRGRFTTEMPSIGVFTPQGLSETYVGCGLTEVAAHGFPILIYPGFQETQLLGTSQKTDDILGNSENFSRVLEMERSLSDRSDAAARGNNIFVYGRKR